MRLNNLVKIGYPSHMKGLVKIALFTLIKKGFVIYYNKNKQAVQLNYKKYQEIMRLIQNGNWKYKWCAFFKSHGG